ncbi:hypothetical protein B5V01_16445 [Mesorhizobium erdmanii]|nr:hypothetical protein B5V01_16445 [Mesorhizobium erdmanii]
MESARRSDKFIAALRGTTASRLAAAPDLFFARSSRSAVASNICSASKFLQLRVFRRLASETTIPYIDFQVLKGLLGDPLIAGQSPAFDPALVFAQTAMTALP